MLTRLTDTKTYTWIRYALCCQPIVVYFFIVYRYSLNIPTMDDYAAILDFLHYFNGAHGMDKVHILFFQHGEHRIFSSRLIYALYDALPGEINFRTIIFIGNLQLLLSYLVAVYFIRRAFPRFWVMLSFVAALFLFDLNGWENAHFAMASMQNYGVVFLFSASIFFYSQRSVWFVLPAVVAQVVCIYSSGNGIVASAFITLFCIIDGSRHRIAVSALATLIFAPLYFLNYDPSARAHASTDYVTIIVYFFRLLSGHIHCLDTMLKVALGIVLFAVSVMVFPVRKVFRLSKGDGFFVSMFGFVLCTMALTSVYRSSMGETPPSRYLIYPHYMALIIFLFALKKIRRERAEKFVIAIAILAILNYIPNLEYGLKDFKAITQKIKATDFDYPYKNVAKAIAERCCAEGIYCIEKHRTGR